MSDTDMFFFGPLRCQKQLEQIGQKIQKARPACHSVHDLKVDLNWDRVDMQVGAPNVWVSLPSKSTLPNHVGSPKTGLVLGCLAKHIGACLPKNWFSYLFINLALVCVT